MTFDEAMSYYRTITFMASELGVSRQTIYLWKEKNKIPFARQAQIELDTKGKLRARHGD